MLPTQPFGRTGHRFEPCDLRRRGSRSDEPRPRRRDDGAARNAMASTTSTRRAGTATPNCDWRRGWRATGTRCSWRPRPASDPGAAARTEFEESLTRLGVDHVDLIQLHNLVEPDEWETAFAPGWRGRGARARRATKDCAGSSGSPATECESRRCTCAACARSTSTPCCSPTTSCCSNARTTGPMSRLCSNVCRARRGRADHQVDRPRSLVGQPRGQVQLVRAADRSRSHRQGRSLRPRQHAVVPQQQQRRVAATGGAGGGRR